MRFLDLFGGKYEIDRATTKMCGIGTIFSSFLGLLGQHERSCRAHLRPLRVRGQRDHWPGLAARDEAGPVDLDERLLVMHAPGERPRPQRCSRRRHGAVPAATLVFMQENGRPILAMVHAFHNSLGGVLHNQWIHNVQDLWII